MSIAQRPSKSRITHSKGHSLRQGLILQDLTFDAASVIALDAKDSSSDKETRAKSATALSNLNRSWTGILDRVRDMKGIAKLRPSEAIPRGTRRPAPHSPPVFDPQDEPAPAPLPTAHNAHGKAA